MVRCVIAIFLLLLMVDYCSVIANLHARYITIHVA